LEIEVLPPQSDQYAMPSILFQSAYSINRKNVIISTENVGTFVTR